MRTLTSRTRAGAATLGLVVAVVVVAMAARAPLSRPTSVDARSAQAPTTAVFVLLAGTGIVMLGALVVLLWPGGRAKDDPPERKPAQFEVHWIWKVVAAVLPFALGAALILAAATGTRLVRTSPRAPGQSLGGAPPGANRSAGTEGGFAAPAWLPWTVVAIVAIGLVAIVLVLWLRRERPAPDQTTAARAAVEAAIGALDDESDPRRGVIAAYGAMQRALGERGVVRAPAEAPREYLRRALITSRATEREATTLTGLFEEARYSTHPIPERLREVALSSLRSLQHRLQADGTR